MNPELREKYTAEVDRLDREYDHYERQWMRMPMWSFAVLMAPIAWYFAGFGAGVAALLVALALIGTRAYLIAMRKSEVRWAREKLVDELAHFDDEPTVSQRGPTLRTQHA